MLKIISTFFKNYYVNVELDKALFPYLVDEGKKVKNQVIQINLYKLIMSIGLIQTRRFAPSNRQKFMDKSDIIEYLVQNTSELKIQVGRIKQHFSTETKITISEDFGVGLSVVVVECLFGIKYETIERIYGTKKRPDWKCQTRDGLVFVIESKGTINASTATSQLQDAVIQKNTLKGDVKVAASTVLNETKITETTLIDPPISTENYNQSEMNALLKTGHYSSLMSFFGLSSISKYYSYMRKRISNSISKGEMLEKINLYAKLKFNSPKIEYNNRTYIGEFKEIEAGLYLFIGIDTDLLNYSYFLNYTYQNEVTYSERLNNHYLLNKDGTLIVEIRNIDYFRNFIDLTKIRSYQDNITILDFDEMEYISIEKLIRYIFKRNGFTILDTKEKDLLVEIDQKIYEVEIKKYKDVSSERNLRELLKEDYKNPNKILITNVDIKRNKNIIILDREKLKKLFKDITKLKDLVKHA